MNEQSSLEPGGEPDKKKNPFKDVFTSFKEFSDALFNIEGIEIANNRQLLHSGPNGAIVCARGMSDGKFHVWVEKAGTIKYLVVRESFFDAQTVAIEHKKEVE